MTHIKTCISSHKGAGLETCPHMVYPMANIYVGRKVLQWQTEYSAKDFSKYFRIDGTMSV